VKSSAIFTLSRHKIDPIAPKRPCAGLVPRHDKNFLHHWYACVRACVRVCVRACVQVQKTTHFGLPFRASL
jgi:hypothetical protein